MVTINSNTKTIRELLDNNNIQFLIPDYQRPYSWRVEHCRTLIDDLQEFAFAEDFNKEKDNYFLGDVTFFKNDCGQYEVIDGQQRIITLTLLIRAFYDSIKNIGEDNLVKSAEKCLWLADGRENPLKDSLKVTSTYLEEQFNNVFKNILLSGNADKTQKDNFSTNYNFFRNELTDLKIANPSKFPDLFARLINNCYVVRIETSSQNEALQVFTTTNDRGMPLNATDIFRSVLYKKFAKQGEAEKQKFIEDWERLVKISGTLFRATTKITPMEGLLISYTMSFESIQSRRATKAYYEKNNYERLLADNFMPDLFALTDFWQDVYEKNRMTRFPGETGEKVLRKIYVLLRIPYAYALMTVSGMFFYLKDTNASGDLNKADELLDRFTAIVFSCALTGSFRANLRSSWNKTHWATLDNNPGKIFENYKINKSGVEYVFRNFQDSRNKKFVTDSVLSWWFFNSELQELVPPRQKFTVEHIVPQDMKNFDKFHDPSLIDSLGNMALLEREINTRANNCSFDVKKRCYVGFNDKGKPSPGTVNRELQKIAHEKADFTETDIRNRNEEMLQTVLGILGKYNLLK